jgi:trigger factor
MKTELTDVSETLKTLTIEIPSDVVDAEINKVAKELTKQARIPGFRPGRVPTGVIKQRFKDQILHEVAHELVPRSLEEALQERGIEPVDTPDVEHVHVHEGQPLRFTAKVETVPPFDPGDLSTIALTQTPVAVTDEQVDHTLQHLRERAAKMETVEGRPLGDGDIAVLTMDRIDAAGSTDHHDDLMVQLGAEGNPPGFDENLLGMHPGDEKTFTIHYPADHPAEELREKDVTYTASLKAIQRRLLPELDDEFAKDLGEFESLAALRDRVRADMQAEAEEQARRQTRTELLSQLSARVGFEPPGSLVEREMDRRIEEFARQLMAQNIDPRQANLDWAQMREAQREPSRTAVASALVLDEIARREQITVAAEDVDKEIERFAERAGRTAAALRAQLEKEGGISRLYAGLRREKAVELALARAKMTSE